MTSFNLNYFLWVPSPNTATLRVRASLWTCGRVRGHWHPVRNKMYALKESEKLGCLCLHSRKTEVFWIAFRVKCLLLKRIESLNNSDKGHKSHGNQRLKPKFQWISWELESHQGPRLLYVYSLWDRFFIWCCRLGRQWKTCLIQFTKHELRGARLTNIPFIHAFTIYIHTFTLYLARKLASGDWNIKVQNKIKLYKLMFNLVL